MITVINRLHGSGLGTLEVLLGVCAEDLDQPHDELMALLEECKTTKRKVGCILNEYAPSIYFSYEPANQAQTETSLLSALCMPQPAVYVSSTSEVVSWDKY